MKTINVRLNARHIPIVLMFFLVSPVTTASDFSLSTFQASSQLLAQVSVGKAINKDPDIELVYREKAVESLRIKEKKSKFYLALLMALKNR
ncbi:hypothetical protein [Neptuniibacter caesariensis]|uniref:Uncharacterized protein n=1 Tax=Neptuniibacter caesariensis TaxID=207954 RepID=A0A7U8GSB8_NEPCE|nr:hypothetical protein [Neptuniibacter caesariensis]EAR61153.1 hypothetical protein MED92_04844 [Oceanospirillum sp. MED92] [Neptuniibacter caesariensis]